MLLSAQTPSFRPDSQNRKCLQSLFKLKPVTSSRQRLPPPAHASLALGMLPGVCFDQVGVLAELAERIPNHGLIPCPAWLQQCQQAADSVFLTVLAVPLLGLAVAIYLKFQPIKPDDKVRFLLGPVGRGLVQAVRVSASALLCTCRALAIPRQALGSTARMACCQNVMQKGSSHSEPCLTHPGELSTDQAGLSADPRPAGCCLMCHLCHTTNASETSPIECRVWLSSASFQ